MDDASLALIGNQLLGQLCTPAECEELVELCRSAKLGSVPYGQSMLSMAQSIANYPGQKEKLLEIARTEKYERDANLELGAFIRETVPPLIRQVAEKGRNEGDAKREFRERLRTFLEKMYPGADAATLYLTIGQAFEDTPGVWKFNVGRVVLALRNLRRFG